MARDCSHREPYSYTDLPEGVLAERFLKRALAYHKAGKRLASDQDAIEPANFLLCHAIELVLKAYLAAKDWGRSALAARGSGHCLECLFERVQHYGVFSNESDLALMMHHLSEYTMIYRYPDFFVRNRIAPDEIIATFERIHNEVAPVVVRAFIDSRRPGTYEVDEFSHLPT